MLPMLNKPDSTTRFMEMAFMNSGGDSAYAYMNSAENPGMPQFLSNLNFNSSKPPTIQPEPASLNHSQLDFENRRENFLSERPKPPTSTALIENLVARTYFANSGMYSRSPEKRSGS